MQKQFFHKYQYRVQRWPKKICHRLCEIAPLPEAGSCNLGQTLLAISVLADPNHESHLWLQVDERWFLTIDRSPHRSRAQCTGLSKRNGAKFKQLSRPELSEIGWLGCAFEGTFAWPHWGREFLDRGHFFCTTLYNPVQPCTTHKFSCFAQVQSNVTFCSRFLSLCDTICLRY